MPSLFQVPEYTILSKKLENYLGVKTKYNPNESAHKELLKASAIDLKKNLTKLTNLDKKIVLGFGVGVAAFMLSYLLPIGVIAVGAFAFCAYCFGLRSQVAKEYERNQKILYQSCKWSLGQIDSKDIDVIRQSDEVKLMIETLAPITSDKQLADVIDDQYELGFIHQANEVKSELKESLFGQDYAFSKEESHLYYGIYGIGQGNPLDILKGLYYLSCKLATNVKNYVTKGDDKKETVAPVEDNTALKPAA